MAYVMLNTWSADLTGVLSAVATTLPVSTAKADELATLLGANETSLFIRDGVYTEVVLATAAAGVVTIARAQEGSTARVFVAGSCAKAELSAAGLAALICSSDCGCIPVELKAGATIEQPILDEAWAHSWFFVGTTPLTVTTIAKPAWATVDTSRIASGLLTISGTPNVGTSATLSLAVAGCNGSVELIEETITVCSPTGIAV